MGTEHALCFLSLLYEVGDQVIWRLNTEILAPGNNKKLTLISIVPFPADTSKSLVTATLKQPLLVF